VETRKSDTILKTLQNHIAEVKKQLIAEGVQDSSISFTYPTVQSGVPGVENPEASRSAVRQQAIQMRNMNPQMRNQFPVPNFDDADDSELPVIFSATTTLTADWVLEKGLDETAVLMPSKMKRLVEEKALSGSRIREVLEDDERSMIEPLMGSNMSYVSHQSSGQDQRFSYVGEMTDEQESKALAEALKKAKARAQVLADAAGVKLGKLRSVQNVSLDSYAAMSSSMMVAYSSAYQTQTQVKPIAGDREVTNADANALMKLIGVHVVYDIQQ
jgi:Protein of unknown function (DUF541)